MLESTAFGAAVAAAIADGVAIWDPQEIIQSQEVFSPNTTEKGKVANTVELFAFKGLQNVVNFCRTLRKIRRMESGRSEMYEWLFSDSEWPLKKIEFPHRIPMI